MVDNNRNISRSIAEEDSPRLWRLAVAAVLTFSQQRDKLKDGWTCICKLVGPDESILHQGLPGDVGGCGHYDIPVLQSFLWRACPLTSPPC
ncbi:Hypothetical predicted protein [Xyrichtys novacula]|uniref:Uncharacterized protein n=1 Tax=Xyrichtys novacula TaxID=13765 RepID=A0AAV1GXH0_XYRNO|nr:Hypothetical predicted protein [Xyrichtys novacula]